MSRKQIMIAKCKFITTLTIFLIIIVLVFLRVITYQYINQLDILSIYLLAIVISTTITDNLFEAIHIIVEVIKSRSSETINKNLEIVVLFRLALAFSALYLAYLLIIGKILI